MLETLQTRGRSMGGIFWEAVVAVVVFSGDVTDISTSYNCLLINQYY